MLLWASKFATAKIECSFEMGKSTPLGVTFIAGEGTSQMVTTNIETIKLLHKSDKIMPKKFGLIIIKSNICSQSFQLIAWNAD